MTTTSVWTAAVTGIKDSVNDVLQPGCFARTLSTRLPKVLKEHDFHKLIGKLLRIVELYPGDPELPETLPNGDPWPVEAGALVVEVEYNQNTQVGKEAYEDAKFVGAGEMRCSIGYRVPTGGAHHNSEGVRVVTDLDLFEVTQCLWGANDAASVISIKSQDGVDGLEYKAAFGSTRSFTFDSALVEMKAYVDAQISDRMGYLDLSTKVMRLAAAKYANDREGAVQVGFELAEMLSLKAAGRGLSDEELGFADAVTEVLDSFNDEEDPDDEHEGCKGLGRGRCCKDANHNDVVEETKDEDDDGELDDDDEDEDVEGKSILDADFLTELKNLGIKI